MKNSILPLDGIFTPRDFMQSKRPELFSDSIKIEEPFINKEQLAFYLAGITERKDENRFESFCRRLAEKEICPNLLPQTGPIGGGDSKVDSETYPVSEKIKDTWYEGSELERGSKERWAFAFSAKKKWKEKIKSDVQKIINTDRDYKLIYFISNQPIRDKERANTEDELRKKHSIDIRILDREWIIEKTIVNNRWEILEQTLGMELVRKDTKTQLGPIDTRRKTELDELEIKIQSPEIYYSSEYQLIEDCIQAALLSRGLELPQDIVYGRLQRAIKIAKKHSWDVLTFKALYNKAWTLTLWYNDTSENKDIYSDIESIARSLDRIKYYENLNNIIQISIPSSTDAELSFWEKRRDELKNILTSLTVHKDRKTSALRAELLLVLIDLTATKHSEENASKLFSSLLKIIKNSQSHIDFPFEYLLNLLHEIEAFFIQNETFTEMLDEAVNIWGSTLSEAEKGKLHLRRGKQLLDMQHYYKAIIEFTKSNYFLRKYEYKDELIETYTGLYLCYNSIELHWAARSCLIRAVDMLFSFLMEENKHSYLIITLLFHLTWLDAKLGIPINMLTYRELARSIESLVPKNKREKYINDLQLSDGLLAILIFKSDYDDVIKLDHMVDCFERNACPMSWLTLLYLLGKYEVLEKFDTREELDTLFKKIAKQPAYYDLPQKVEWFFDDVLFVETIILGSKIHISTKRTSENILFMHTIAAMIESLFSTSILDKKMMAHRENFNIKIVNDIAMKTSIKIELNENELGETHLLITYRDIASIYQEKESQHTMKTIASLLAHLMVEISYISSEEATKKFWHDDEAIGRTVISIESHSSSVAIFGATPKFLVTDWIKPEDKAYDLSRTKIEVLKIQIPPARDQEENTEPVDLSKLLSDNKAKHNNFRVITPILIKLWDKASWKGLASGVIPTHEGAFPFISLMFANYNAGGKIFAGWLKRVGNYDKNDEISISIITGIDKDEPLSYRIIIHSNLDHYAKKASAKKQFLISTQRIHTMNPTNDTTLNFIKDINKHNGQFGLTYGGIENGELKYGDSHKMIIKTKLHLHTLTDAPAHLKSFI